MGSEVVVSLVVVEYLLLLLPNVCLGVIIAGDITIGCRESCELPLTPVGEIERVMGDDEEKAPTLLAPSKAINSILVVKALAVCLLQFRSLPEFILWFLSVVALMCASRMKAFGISVSVGNGLLRAWWRKRLPMVQFFGLDCFNRANLTDSVRFGLLLDLDSSSDACTYVDPWESSFSSPERIEKLGVFSIFLFEPLLY